MLRNGFSAPVKKQGRNSLPGKVQREKNRWDRRQQPKNKKRISGDRGGQ
jgi:hypothetical protein